LKEFRNLFARIHFERGDSEGGVAEVGRGVAEGGDSEGGAELVDGCTGGAELREDRIRGGAAEAEAEFLFLELLRGCNSQTLARFGLGAGVSSGVEDVQRVAVRGAESQQYGDADGEQEERGEEGDEARGVEQRSVISQARVIHCDPSRHGFGRSPDRARRASPDNLVNREARYGEEDRSRLLAALEVTFLTQHFCDLTVSIGISSCWNNDLTHSVHENFETLE